MDDRERKARKCSTSTVPGILQGELVNGWKAIMGISSLSLFLCHQNMEVFFTTQLNFYSLQQLIKDCWNNQPRARPQFSRIAEFLQQQNVPPELARRRISFSEPEKMNFIGRKMNTLSIKWFLLPKYVGIIRPSSHSEFALKWSLQACFPQHTYLRILYDEVLMKRSSTT